MSALGEFLESAGDALQAAATNTRDALIDISDSAGAAPLHAFIRQGADEISQILPAFPSQGIQPVSEMGQMMEPTPGAVDRQIQPEMDLDMG